MADVELCRPGRHIKRLGVLFVACVFVVLGAWGVLTWGTKRELEQARARLVAAGYPGRWSGFKPVAQVPDAENRWLGMVAAMKKISSAVESPSNSNDWWQDADRVPYPTDWFLRANASAGLNVAAFDEAVTASRRPRWDLGRDFSEGGDPGSIATTSNVWDLRLLVSTLADEALRRHFVGDDAGAFELIEAAMKYAECLSDDPMAFSMMTRQHCECLVVIQNIYLMASRLRIGTGSGEVHISRVKSLVLRLVGQDPRRDIQRVLVGNALAYDAAIRSKTKPWQLRGTIAAKKVAVRIADALEMNRRNPPPGEIGLLVESNFSGFNSLAGSSSITTFIFRSAGTALAVAAYRAEHGGGWPTSLDLLVPAYLPEVPLDPHGTSAERFQLRLHEPLTGRWRPMLWAVGRAGRMFRENEVLPSPPCYGWTSSSKKPILPQLIDLERYEYIVPSSVEETPNR